MPEGGRLAQARQLVSRLDFPAAQQLLRDELARAHVDPHAADESEADSAALYAGVMLQLNEPHTARTWAAYAHTAARLQHGEFDRRTLHALGLLALAQHRTGALRRAGLLYTQLVEDLTRVEGHRGDRTLAARADAAVVDHARGHCEQARDQLSDVVAAYEHRHGAGHPIAVRMLVRLAGMWRDCGDFDQAHRLLTQAREHTAGLAAADDLHRLLHAATRAPADPYHHCGVDPTAGPDDEDPPPPSGSAYAAAPEPPSAWPPPRSPEPDAWPATGDPDAAPSPAEPDAWPTGPDSRHATEPGSWPLSRTGEPEPWYHASAPADRPHYTDTEGWTETPHQPYPDERGTHGWTAAEAPPRPHSDERGTHDWTAAETPPQPPMAAAPHVGRVSADYWPDDEIFEPEPAPGTGRSASGRGSRPSPRPGPTAAAAPVLTAFGTQAAPVTPDRYPAAPPVTDRPESSARHPFPDQPAFPGQRVSAGQPVLPERRVFPGQPMLPDRRPGRDDVSRDDPGRAGTGGPRRRGRLAAALAVAAALVAIAAVVATLVLVNGSEKPAATSSPGPVGPSALPAVYGLTLHDEGRQVQLSWTYPANVAAPLIVSVAFAGQPMRPLQSLPAGTETFTVPGLEPNRDYCLTITLAYAADRMVMAPAVCTER
ncbi:hypothetical protein QEZ54_15545 [Catellatospora sp. KI3]|uniref:hypothetical protein n=1 Tax=Catellatospora sp. KI3 TaxID=3041620 RepID=UPI002482EA4C|nr:hypothetical protein [Catellatospora sp. KI3]MDI1462384.1 hypothetical protein [Catellatospora sp. KI3]